MGMKPEQMIAAAFLAAGAVAGIVSNYLNSFLAFPAAIALYIFSSSLAFGRIGKEKKLISESLIVFVLIWALVWTTLNSLW